MRRLQDILDDLPAEALPAAWVGADRVSFSRTKRLWDYQQAALENAVKTLWKYYEDFTDYHPAESSTVNSERKARLFQWYRDNGLEHADNLDIPIPARRDVRRLLEEFYPVDDGRISYEHFINRIGFWMATGSGKTLVLVKLIELLWWLIRQGEIPPNDLLVLTCRDDLIDQLKSHVDEFNAASRDFHIHLRELRQYPDVKRGNLSLFHAQEITVFYYRSDNLSDEQKEKIVDFRNYDDHGRWYILLDEAHKGDREDSKRQHIYSILCRNGFLFNFSATFADPRDVLTTAYDFNLARFVKAGYGKHVVIITQDNRAFRRDEDYTGEEKQKVVLKALIMLAYAHQAYQMVRQEAPNAHVYHRPLLLTLVNSVNTRDADLKLFFRELERIGRGDVAGHVWQEVKDELRREFVSGLPLLFESEQFRVRHDVLDSINQQTVLETVYNASAPGAIEVWVRPSSRQELAFKLKSADRPFALIKIGDIANWLKEELSGYDVLEGYSDEGFFERLNADDSAISILMGSRSFYEGWDSNRPNVITFVNIGTGTDARKFILQSVGRGVRIEPLPNRRKRLQALHNAGQIDEPLYRSLRDHVLPLETVLIFGTNRQALQTVIEQLDLDEGKELGHELALDVNRAAVDNHLLLIPIYRQAAAPLLAQQKVRKFDLAADELGLLRAYREYFGDDRVLVARHNVAVRHVGLLRRCLAEPGEYFNTDTSRRYGSLDLILKRLGGYFDVVPQEVHYLKPLEDEIQHFRHVRVLLADVSTLQSRIRQVRDYPRAIRELQRRYEARQLPFDQFVAAAQAVRPTAEATLDHSRLEIRYVANHYYVPILLSHDERIDYIRHVIRHPSEIRFLDALESYVAGPGNRFGEFDWWLFSKIDETLDQVYLPYYDPHANAIRRFHPDFVFWLQKGGDYFVLFVDPKGVQLGTYPPKVEGYRQLFEDESGKPRSLDHQGLTVRVGLCLYTADANLAPEAYRRYWYDHPGSLLDIFS